MRIAYSARSHVGRIRENNEDNLVADGTALPLNLGNRSFALDGVAEYPAVFAIADGMGGMEDGEIASRLTVATILRFEEKLRTAKAEQLAGIVQTCVKEADAAIRTSSGKYRQSGTTLALAVISRRGAYCFSLGDSRIYALHGTKLHRVSHDHTWFAEHMGDRDALPVRRGSLYKLTGCIGAGLYREAEAYPPVGGSYRLLLCSDGLTDKVSAAEIREILRCCADTDEAADMLLSLALQKGGHDNISVIIADGKTALPAFLAGRLDGGKHR